MPIGGYFSMLIAISARADAATMMPRAAVLR